MAPPANDDFANAELIVGTSGSVAFTNVDATVEAGEPVSSNGNSENFATVWFQWTAPSSCPYRFDLNASPDAIDTVLAIWTGVELPLLLEAASDDDGGTGALSDLTFTPIAGITYWIQVRGYSETDVGDLVLTWDEQGPVEEFADDSAGYSGVEQFAAELSDDCIVEFTLTGAGWGDDPGAGTSCGGRVHGFFPASAGDVISMVIGANPWLHFTGPGAITYGFGGYPDGGNSANAPDTRWPGGSGASAIFLNGTLVAIAGAAGAVPASGTSSPNSAGGDPDGHAGAPDSGGGGPGGGASPPATGGSVGTNGSGGFPEAPTAGASRQGGDGGRVHVSGDPGDPNNWNYGGAGGGGYFGGGGGGASAPPDGAGEHAGGGGSSWADPDLCTDVSYDLASSDGLDGAGSWTASREIPCEAPPTPGEIADVWATGLVSWPR